MQTASCSPPPAAQIDCTIGRRRHVGRVWVWDPFGEQTDSWPVAPFALDKTANIAPLEDLPQILAASLPSARFLSVWHSVARIHRHYGEPAAAELLANCISAHNGRGPTHRLCAGSRVQSCRHE